MSVALEDRPPILSVAHQLGIHFADDGKAVCPFHDDHNPSLTRFVGEDGIERYKCFACGASGDVFDLIQEIEDCDFIEALERGQAMMGSPPEDDDDDDDSGFRAQRDHASSATGLTLAQAAIGLRLPLEQLRAAGWHEDIWEGAPAVAIPYPEGVVRYRIALDGDKFRWPIGTKAKGLLYRSDTIELAAGSGIFLVEGESDVEAIRAAGLLAVGLPGAGMWHEQTHAPQFTDLDFIYVIQEPGEAAQKLVEALTRSAIRDKVRTVTLPDGTKDARAFYLLDPATAGTRLVQALSNAQQLPTPNGLTFHDAASILRTKLVLPTYDVPGLVAPGTITALGGYVGDGKTPLTARMAKALLYGRLFIDIPVPRAPDDYRVVYLTQESMFTFQPLLQSAGLDPDLASGRLEVVYLHEALGSGLSWNEIIRQAGERVGPRGLLIVDPLSDWAQVKNEDDNAQMAEAFRPVIQTVGGGRSAWVIMHAWKSFQKVPDSEADVMHIRGAGAITSNASIVVLYKQPSDESGANIRYLKVARNRFATPFQPRYVELNGNDLRHVEVLERAVKGKAATAQTIYAAIPNTPQGIGHTALQEKTGIHWGKLNTGLDLLVEQGKIRPNGKLRSKTDPRRWVRCQQG